MYNTVSEYPEKIDPLIFYQDLKIDDFDIMNNYYQLLSEEKYTEASNYIKNYDIDGAFADLFNLMINRIKKLQEHIKPITKQEKVFFETERPSSVSQGTIWISKRENEV